MKGSTIALDHIGERQAAARIVDGQLDDFIIDPPDWVIPPESLFRGKLGRPVKGLGGAFVDLPDGQSGFLRQTKGLRPGDPILVQVTGLAEQGKAVPVTTRLLFKSRYAIVTPDAPGLNISRQIDDDDLRADLDALARDCMDGAGERLGLILRSACMDTDEAEIADDILQMRSLAEQVLGDLNGPPELLLAAPGAHELAWRDWEAADTLDDQPGSFARHAVDDALDTLRRPEVSLPQGASMVIEPTRALVAVDVNTGPDTSPAAGLKANIAAIRALPQQLRLRGLGGQVVIDLAPYPKREKQVLEQVMRAAFKRDGRDTVLAGFTPLGNFELTRKRDRVALSVLLP
ncbi:ribonuclease E/G [Roseibaca sp. Y0-43]|uniref:ribonuclease E/G n=1 Tax=Roseibaca sp. Y0-43 TaxID=2816854 RepID=UPI001D0C4C9D|nr:ribonuclease E/G [Roseibaca sp. Y0-43]MCC1482826.1 ribonuclease E/G [Roseibaca sp. Y0-43]